MPGIKTYHRPKTLYEALAMLSEEGESAAVLAGGTTLLPFIDKEKETVIDLQDIGLDQIDSEGGKMTCGTLVRLQDLADHLDTPDLVREMVYHEGPNTFRNISTLGGAVASADWESELLAALLVCDASMTISKSGGSIFLSLEEFLASPENHLKNGVITDVTYHTSGKTASARVAKTPADKPIVAAVGHKDAGGDMLFALCGVANTPILISKNDLDQLSPPEDFRGSGEYRKEMAKTLIARIQESLEG